MLGALRIFFWNFLCLCAVCLSVPETERSSSGSAGPRVDVFLENLLCLIMVDALSIENLCLDLNKRVT